MAERRRQADDTEQQPPSPNPSTSSSSSCACSGSTCCCPSSCSSSSSSAASTTGTSTSCSSASASTSGCSSSCSSSSGFSSSGTSSSSGSSSSGSSSSSDSEDTEEEEEDESGVCVVALKVFHPRSGTRKAGRYRIRYRTKANLIRYLFPIVRAMLVKALQVSVMHHGGSSGVTSRRRLIRTMKINRAWRMIRSELEVHIRRHRLGEWGFETLAAADEGPPIEDNKHHVILWITHELKLLIWKIA